MLPANASEILQLSQSFKRYEVYIIEKVHAQSKTDEETDVDVDDWIAYHEYGQYEWECNASLISDNHLWMLAVPSCPLVQLECQSEEERRTPQNERKYAFLSSMSK